MSATPYHLSGDHRLPIAQRDKPTTPRNTADLDRMADTIEHVLRAHRINMVITGGNLTPVAIFFQMAGAIDFARIKSHEKEIAHALGTPAQVIAQGQAIHIVAQRLDPDRVRLPAMLDRLPGDQLPPITALLGLADDSAPLLIRLPSAEVGGHVLISGATGTGKTSLLTTIGISLAKYNKARALQFVLSGHALGVLDRLPQVVRIALPDLAQRLGDRDEHTQPAIVCAIDDLDDLSAPDRAAADNLIERGKRAGVFVVATTRATERAAWPTTITADQKLGRFTAHTSTDAIDFTAAYATPTEIDTLINDVR